MKQHAMQIKRTRFLVLATVAFALVFAWRATADEPPAPRTGSQPPTHTSLIPYGLRPEAGRNPYPFVVAVKGRRDSCSGSRIGCGYVLTAAHCISEDGTIQDGDNGDHFVANVVETFRAPGWVDPGTRFNIGADGIQDLMLVKTDERPTRLRNDLLDFKKKTYAGTSRAPRDATVVGYGYGSLCWDENKAEWVGCGDVDKFSYGTVKLQESTTYERWDYALKARRRANIIRALPGRNNQTIAPGDSGGPLLDDDGTILGVSHAVRGRVKTKGEFESYFTDIGSHLQWIYGILRTDPVTCEGLADIPAWNRGLTMRAARPAPARDALPPPAAVPSPRGAILLPPATVRPDTTLPPRDLPPEAKTYPPPPTIILLPPVGARTYPERSEPPPPAADLDRGPVLGDPILPGPDNRPPAPSDGAWHPILEPPVPPAPVPAPVPKSIPRTAPIQIPDRDRVPPPAMRPPPADPIPPPAPETREAIERRAAGNVNDVINRHQPRTSPWNLFLIRDADFEPFRTAVAALVRVPANARIEFDRNATWDAKARAWVFRFGVRMPGDRKDAPLIGEMVISADSITIKKNGVAYNQVPRR